MLESRAERSALGAAPDLAVAVDVGLNFDVQKYNRTAEESQKQTNKWHGYHLRVRLAQQEACFDSHKQTSFVFAT